MGVDVGAGVGVDVGTGASADVGTTNSTASSAKRINKIFVADCTPFFTSMAYNFPICRTRILNFSVVLSKV